MDRQKRSDGFLARYGSAIIMGLAALCIAGTADLFAGLVLNSMEDYILTISGMMILIYSAIGMRGNIFGAMGSRIGTAMNIGTFEMSLRKGTVLRANFDSAIALSLIMSIAMGAVTWLVALIWFGGNADIWDLIFISSVGGFLAGIIVVCFNILIAYVGNKREWDVDNITAPLIAAIGDIVTVPMIFFATWVFLEMDDYSWGETATIIMTVAIVAVTALYTWRMLKAKTSRRDFSGEAKRIFYASLPVLMFCLIFEIGAGIVIQDEEDSLVQYGVLMIMMPAFLNQGNALSGMLTSKLSSAIHLGTLSPRWNPKGAGGEFAMILVCSVITFAYIGTISYAACILVNGGSGIGFLTSMAIIMAAGMITTAVLSLLSYYVAVASTKFGLDPDDESIPITSSVMDLVGSIILVSVISVFI